ncbi:MAG: response regulator [Chloroflexi bacterium]|nr:response regulator [Chloroflexota bacterium]
MARILIVDDDDGLRTMMQIMLKRSGHEVTLASNGAAGLELAEKQPFDIFLLDVMMPDMNGYEVARRLRAAPATQNIPIIVLTARAQPVDQKSAIVAGADAYFSKPVAIEALNAKIAELLITGSTAAKEGEAVTASSAAPATSAPPPRAGRLICVAGWRGGVGSTTLAVNIASVLTSAGRRVCLVDLSPTSSHAALMLRLRPKPSWADLPANPALPTVGALLLKHKSGLHLLASPEAPPTEIIPADAFAKTFRLLLDVFGDVVVDAAPTPDGATRAALALANDIILPIAPEVASIQTLNTTLAIMTNMQISPNTWRVVINHPTPNDPMLLPDRIEKALNRPIDATLPYDHAHMVSLFQGAPLAFTQPNSPYVAALGALLQKL